MNGLNQNMVSQNPNVLLFSIGGYLYMLSSYLSVMQIGEKFSKPPAEDVFYDKTRSMLYKLGLQDYEKNFRKGLLTDSTLPLLTDRQVASYILIHFLHLFWMLIY